MATDALSYTGINRAVSDFAGAKACEELINLRPATEGTVPVKEFSVKMSNVPFLRFFAHHTTFGPRFIVIVRGGTNDGYALVQRVDADGSVLQTLFSTPWLGDGTLESIHYASAGNIVLISLCDQDHGAYENKAYIWKEGAYVEMEADIPELSYTLTETVKTVTGPLRQLDNDATAAEVVDEYNTAINAVQEQNPDLCTGPIIIAVAFKTKDGNTFWTNIFRPYDPVPAVGTSYPPYVDENTPSWSGPTEFPTMDWAAYFDKYGFAYETVEQGPKFKMTGTVVKLTFDKLAAGAWDKDTSIVQSVEVYSSRPVPYLDASAAYDSFGPFGVSYCLPLRKYDEMDLGGQILYHQASITMESLSEDDQEVELAFGGNLQVAEDTLDTDAGALKRYGRLLSYNARFHYWDSVAHIDIGMPQFASKGATGGVTNVFVQYADDEGSSLLWVGAETTVGTGGAYIVVAPSLNIKEVVTYEKASGYHRVRKYRMQESSTYNYAICVGDPYYDSGSQSGTDPDYEALIPQGGIPQGITRKEPDAINVTEQYNPFVFRVEHSYLAPGNVLDIQPQMAGIADSSYGRDPLTVFTERGTYALTQGSANVLYGAFLPLSPNVISGKGAGGALPTDMGTFYLGDGCLWLIAGRRSTLISDALHLGPHKYIRTSPGYQRISGGGSATPEYDVSALVSQVTFEQFVRTGARLSFNRFRMELLISNPLYPYTYVLSLKYRQWFKIGRRLWQDEAGGDTASTPGATPGHIDVVDLSTEEATAQVLVHMQTRPFSMGYRYIHMHRIVAMVRARLAASAGDKLVVGLYGSDDLQNWRLLAYSKRDAEAGVVELSQIRTTPAARSWRYYTVCIGGPVPPDADFGPILVDYEPVIRRIG